MTVTIDTDAVINSILLTEQGSTPTTPGVGLDKLYVTTNGLYLLNSAGAIIGPYITGTASGLSVGRVLISEQSPSGTNTVTWSSIPATYKSLEIEFIGRGTQVATDSYFSIYFNNATTASDYRYIRVFGAAASSVGADGNDIAYIGSIAAANAGANSAGMGMIKIVNYASTTFYKNAIGQSTFRGASNSVTIVHAGVEWESATAINRVDIVLSSGNFVAGSTFRLYGVY